MKMTVDELERLLKPKAKGGKRGSREEVFKTVRELCIKYDYIPLAPYSYIQHTMHFIKSKLESDVNPIKVLEDLAYIILNPPEEYIVNEDTKKRLELLRWAIQALQVSVDVEFNVLFELAKAIRDFIERGFVDDEIIIRYIKARRQQQMFKKTGYRESVTLADILASTGFAKRTKLYQLEDIHPQERKLLRSTAQTMMLMVAAPYSGYPQRRIGDFLARVLVQTGIEYRTMIVRLIKEGEKRAIDIYDYVREHIFRTLRDRNLNVDVARMAVNYASTVLFEDIIATRIYMAYYGILALELVRFSTLLEL